MQDSGSYSDVRAPRTLVVGAGAVGSVLAASLWRAGVPVEVLTKPAHAAEAAARDGFSVGGVGFDARFTARPTVTAEAKHLRHQLEAKAPRLFCALMPPLASRGRDGG